MSESEIPLAEVIRQLRRELMDAMKAGEGESLRFEVEDLEIEMQVVVAKGGAGEVSGETGVKFWVLARGGAQASVKYESSQVQKVKLKLRPKTEVDGKSETVMLSG